MVMVSVMFLSFRKAAAEDKTMIAVNVSTSPFDQYTADLYNEIGLDTQGLTPEVFQKAMTGYYNLKAANKLDNNRSVISVADFTKKSTEKRFWVIDLKEKKVLYHTLIAHGRNTGEQYARNFSNTSSSNMSSLGFYVTAETYIGKHGLSLAIDGMDKGFNDNARNRSVVVHGADYVSEDFIKNVGRLGRSQGCPALPTALAPEIINAIQGGTTLFIYYPDKDYNKTTPYYDSEVALKEFRNDQTLGLLN
jgi:hypothetical protein